jgi:splicing factor 3B subunit 3
VYHIALVVATSRTLIVLFCASRAGKKKLLKKIENKQFPTAVVRIHTLGDRIYVGDMCESVHFVKYRRAENVLAIFADDSFPR